MYTVIGIAKMLARAGVQRLLVAGVFFGVSTASLAVLATGALSTNTQTVAANMFATGTVDISTNPTGALVTLSNMAAGDKVTAPIAVSNARSFQL